MLSVVYDLLIQLLSMWMAGLLGSLVGSTSPPVVDVAAAATAIVLDGCVKLAVLYHNLWSPPPFRVITWTASDVVVARCLCRSGRSSRSSSR